MTSNPIPNEPIITSGVATGLAAAIIRALTEFGWVQFSEQQTAAIMTLVAIAFPIIMGVVARQWVTPVAKLPDAGAVNAGQIDQSTPATPDGAAA